MQITTVEYRSSGSLAKLLLKNTLFNLLTLTIYRFWAKTNLRRYFWQAIRIGGDPLEYTGLGRELFVGFLIVMAILAPLTLVWGAAQAFLLTDPVANGIARVIYVLLLFALIQAARFRARRYRLSRTRWRGIRAGQDGSTWRYIGLALMWGTVSIVTLGLGFPGMRTALQRYRMTNTRIGDQHFSFEARALPLLPRWLLVVALAALPYAAASYLMWQVIAPFISGAQIDEAKMQEALAAGMNNLMASFTLVFVAVLFGSVAYLWYRTAEFRYFVEHTRLGDLQFRSTLGFGAVASRFIFFALCVIAILIFGPIVAFFFTGVIGTMAGIGKTMLVTVIGVISVFLVWFALRFLWTTLVTVGVLQRLCDTLEISGPTPLSFIAQTTASESRYGEGLADSFELAG